MNVISIQLSLFIWMCLNVLAQCPGSDWTGERTLVVAKEFTLNYKVVNDLLVIRLRAKTTGYLGFGLSETGHMLGSDIVTVAMVNGEARIEDRFAGWTSFSPDDVETPWNIPPPRKDLEQSWQSECASEIGGYTEVILSRPLSTADCADREIVDKDMFVIFAWSDEDDVAYHGTNRGSIIVNFFEGSPNEFSPSDFTAIEEIFLDDYSLASSATQYVLQMVDLGPDNVRHIIAIEPAIRDTDTDFIQHMILHDCGDSEIKPLNNSIDLPLNIPVDGSAFNGGQHLSPLGMGTCKNVIIAFGKKSDPIVFPPQAGVRLGNGGARWLILEVHLHNKGLEQNKNRVIHSGIRFYSTNELRENDIGTLVLGNPDVNFNPLAPGRVRVHREATCTEACTQQFEGPINLFYSFPRMHSFGKEIWTTLNEEVISSKEYYNTEFQYHIPLAITLRPNDVLSTHCVFDTSQTTNPVYFGLPMMNEMCMDLILYWPKSNFNRLKCGWTAGDRTICGDIRGLENSNPIADGTNTIPLGVSVGGPTCTAFESATFTPTHSPGNASRMCLSIYSIALSCAILAILVFT